MPKRRCLVCREKFTPSRSDAVTCSNACRQRAYRARKNPLFPKGSPACDFDWEHGGEPGAFQRARAAKSQLLEAERLADEFALLQPGTGKQEIKRARVNGALKVAAAWKRTADKLRRRLSNER